MPDYRAQFHEIISARKEKILLIVNAIGIDNLIDCLLNDILRETPPNHPDVLEVLAFCLEVNNHRTEYGQVVTSLLNQN